MSRSHAARRRPDQPATREEDLIARAEAAVAQLSIHFAGWMQDDCRRLAGLCRLVESAPSNLHALDQLFRAAHDVEGEASAFGFPAVERIAASLCRLIADAPDRTRIPFELIARHVAATRLALHADDKSDLIADELEQASGQYLSSAGRPSNCPDIEGPPLAPDA